MSCILLFGLGVLIDAVWALSVQSINEKRPWSASAFQSLFTAIAVGSTWWVIEDRSWAGLLAYSIGGGVGTFWAVTRSGR